MAFSYTPPSGYIGWFEEIVEGVGESSSQSIIWSELTNSPTDIFTITSSSSGQRVVTTDWSGEIYTSNDYGATWTTQIDTVALEGGKFIASSSSGQYLAACGFGYIHTSNDYGVTWTQQTGSTSQDWKYISISDDGQYLAATAYGNYLYVSSDYGVTWTAKTSLGTKDWFGVDSSSSGQYLTACVYNEYFYTSNDYGATWTQVISAFGSRLWRHLVVSEDGSKVVVGVYYGNIFTSNDYGATWTDTGKGGGWERVTANHDCSKIYAISEGSTNVIDYSEDFGVTWKTLSIPDSPYRGIKVSGDGNRLYFGGYTDHVYGGIYPVIGYSQTIIGQAATASGTSAVNAVGRSFAASVGASAGISTVSAIGRAIKPIVASSSGTSVVSGVGRAIKPIVASSSGTSTVSAIGLSFSFMIGSITGNSVVSGVGNAIVPAVGISSPNYFYASPNEDVTTGSWVNESESNTDLYSSLNESIANNDTYIKTSTPNDECEMKVSGFENRNLVIYYNAFADDGGMSNVEISLMDSSTVVLNWSHSLSNSVTTYSKLITQDNLAGANLNNLSIKIKAVA